MIKKIFYEECMETAAA